MEIQNLSILHNYQRYVFDINYNPISVPLIPMLGDYIGMFSNRRYKKDIVV